jgi:PqqD family protein of HPr-rel-A system
MSEYKVSESLAISDSGFLFMPSTGESFTVNETGILIITLLKKGATENEIIEELIKQYDIDRETAQRDFDEYITLLRNLKLIEKL